MLSSELIDGAPNSLGIRGLRIKAKVLFQFVRSLLILVATEIKTAKILVNQRDIIPTVTHRKLKLLFSLFITLGPDEGHTKVVVSVRAAAIEFEGLAQVRLRLVQFILIVEGDAEIELRRSISSAQFYQCLKRLSCLVPLTEFEILDAKLIQASAKPGAAITAVEQLCSALGIPFVRLLFPVDKVDGRRRHFRKCRVGRANLKPHLHRNGNHTASTCTVNIHGLPRRFILFATIDDNRKTARW